MTVLIHVRGALLLVFICILEIQILVLVLGTQALVLGFTNSDTEYFFSHNFKSVLFLISTLVLQGCIIFNFANLEYLKNVFNIIQ